MVFDVRQILNESGRNVFMVAALVFTLLALITLYLSLARKNVEDGVYRIMVSSDAGWGHGSGFKVADPGILVTNNHVIDGAKRIQVAFMEDGKAKFLDARIVWYNSDKDLAILRTEEPLPGKVQELAGIGTSELAKTESVTAIGFPAIADRVAREMERGVLDTGNRDQTFLDPTVSSGTIQRLVPTVQRLTIQHSANINSGNSGGPLFDRCNRVVGVNTLGTRSTVGASDIFNALTRSGRVTVDDPGDLEFAVHVREVLLGLNEKEISASVTPGVCRGGLDVYELTAIGSSTALAFMSVLFAGVYWRNHSSRTEQGVAFADDIDTELQISDTPIPAEKVDIVLRDAVSGHVYSMARHDADLGGAGVVLGRPGGAATILIDDASVSRRHARIRYHGDNLVVHDEGSTNGTRLDGAVVTRTQGQILSPGSVLRLGSMELMVEQGQTNQSGSTIGFGKRRWLLSGFDLKGTTIQYTVTEGTPAKGVDLSPVCTIGRNAESDVVIDDESVSRRHAQIGMNSRGVLSIVDLGSSNGTFVDGQRVGATAVEIKNAKILTFGQTELTISLQS